MSNWWVEENHLQINASNHLSIGGVDCVELVQQFGSPLYVLNAGKALARFREIRDVYNSFGVSVKVHFAMKANSSLALLKLLSAEGAGIDAVSGGEIFLARKAGVKGKNIIFTSNAKSDDELELALKNNVVINLDSETELQQISRVAGRMGKTALISFRANPDVTGDTHASFQTGKAESKFGIQFERALGAYKQALSTPNLKPVGVHMHIGSQILEAEPFEQAVRKLFELVAQLKQAGVKLKFIDLGGGIGIRYKEEQKKLEAREVASRVMPIVAEKLRELNLQNIEIKIEPGRFIVGEAGVLLARVLNVKQGVHKKFLAVDAGFHVLARPKLYDAYHEVVNASKVNAGEGEKEIVEVVGNICEGGDVLAKERKLPRASEGDVLAFLCAGAYGMSMASEYNSRPLPAEVLILNNEAKLARKRRDYKDLLKMQASI